jgi:hypothetical protein
VDDVKQRKAAFALGLVLTMADSAADAIQSTDPSPGEQPRIASTQSDPPNFFACRAESSIAGLGIFIAEQQVSPQGRVYSISSEWRGNGIIGGLELSAMWSSVVDGNLDVAQGRMFIRYGFWPPLEKSLGPFRIQIRPYQEANKYAFMLLTSDYSSDNQFISVEAPWVSLIPQARLAGSLAIVVQGNGGADVRVDTLTLEKLLTIQNEIRKVSDRAAAEAENFKRKCEPVHSIDLHGPRPPLRPDPTAPPGK